MSKDNVALRQTGITAITIENFKGIGAPVTVPLRPITLLFGANSAGKSTIIQAIHYARELLLRNNPNADIPLAGGNAIDLGGFKNIVHRHEASRTIRIGFEIALDDDGLPGLDEITGVDLDMDVGYWQTLEKLRIQDALMPDLEEMLDRLPENALRLRNRLELMKRNKELVAEREPNINAFIRTAGLQLGVRWNAQKHRPWLSEVKYSLDNRPLFTISQENEGSIPAIVEIDLHHPAIESVFTPVLGDDSDENAPTAASEFESFFSNLEDSQGRVLLKGQASVIPDLTKPLPLGISMDTSDGDYGYEFFIAAIVNQAVLGTTSLIKQELDKFRYVGPIRERPNRFVMAPAVLDEARWADGTAAWDQLLKHYDPELKRGDDFVRTVSEWLSDSSKLDLGYSIDVQGQRNIPEGSMLMANLRLLREKFDEKDEDFFRQLIWHELESAEIRPELYLHDLKNDVRVGPTDIGMGVIQAIPIVVAALDPSKHLLCMEQPELHLHPSAQARIGDLFIDSAEEGKILLVETHSELLILRLLKRIRQTTAHEIPSEAQRLTPEEIGVVYVERSKEGAEVTLLEVDAEGEFKEKWPGKDGFFEERARELFE